MLRRMERIDLELYADRLARHADRLLDDIRAARVRLAWNRLEARARQRLPGADCRALEAVGVLADGPPTGDDEEVIRRREEQLEALGRLQAFVEEELAALRGGTAAARRGERRGC